MSSRATVGRKTGVLVALAGLVLVGGPAAPYSAPAMGATAPSKAQPLPQVTRFSLPDLTGHRHSPAEWRGRKALVVIFLGTECPVSNGYAPVLARLARAYQPRGVAFYGIYPDPDVTAAVAAQHAANYGLTFCLLLDPHQVLATQTGVEYVPEAVVLSATGQVLYRGRIDDLYALNGRRRDKPRSQDLENALEAVLAGRRPNPAQTQVFGCPLPPKADAQP